MKDRSGVAVPGAWSEQATNLRAAEIKRRKGLTTVAARLGRRPLRMLKSFEELQIVQRIRKMRDREDVRMVRVIETR